MDPRHEGVPEPVLSTDDSGNSSSPEEGAALPSSEDLARYTEELKARVALAQQQRDAHIGKQLADRERLIADARNVESLLQQARETHAYFAQMDAHGALTDATDRKRYDEVQQLVGQLESQHVTINDRIAAISNEPQTLERLQSEAETEDQRREVEQLRAEAKKDLEPQTKEYIGKVAQLAQDFHGAFERREHAKAKSQEALGTLQGLVEAAQGNISRTSETHRAVQYRSQEETFDDYIARLRTLREQLPFYKGKERKALDTIITYSRLKTIRDGIQTYHDVSADIRELDSRQGALTEEYQTLMKRAWEWQGRINAVAPARQGIPHELPSNVHSEMRRAWEALAMKNIKRDSRGQMEEKFPGWFKANQASPANGILYRITQDIEKKAGGSSIAYSPPDKWHPSET